MFEVKLDDADLIPDHYFETLNIQRTHYHLAFFLKKNISMVFPIFN